MCELMCRAKGGESLLPEPPLSSTGEEASAPGSSAERVDGSAADGAGSQLLQGVAFHALESRNDGVLWDVQPAFVVMVDSDVAFVRQLEVTHRLSALPICHTLSLVLKPMLVFVVHCRRSRSTEHMTYCSW